MRKVLLILALLLPATSIGQENLCQTKISTSTKDKKNVFLAGGEAYTLFENYIRQAKVDPGNVVVHFWDGNKTVSYEVGIWERFGYGFSGMSVMDIWKKKARKR